MSEKYTLEEHQQYVEEQQRKTKEAEQARREQTEKATAKRDWIAAGGNEGDFEREWPEIRSAQLVGEVLGRQGEAREESRRRTRASF